MAKPKNKSTGRVVKTDLKPKYAAPGHSEPIQYETIGWGTIVTGWAKGAIIFLIVAILILLATYTGLAGTIAYVTKIDNSNYIVARNTFVGGEATPNSVVYASATTAVSTEPIDRILEGGKGLFEDEAIPDAGVYQIIAAPNSKFVANDDDTITFFTDTEEERTVPSPSDFDGEKTFTTSYVVKCLTGACESGTITTLDGDNIAGELLDMQGQELKL